MIPINQETEKLLYKLIDNANVLVLYLDAAGNVSLCNKKVEEIAGMKRQDILGLNWPKVLYHGEVSVLKQQMLKAVMDDSMTYKRTNNFEGLINIQGNRERFICWSITPIVSETEQIEGTLLIGNDVTELKEREASLKKIDETLKDIFSSIKEYALYVANLDGNITYYGMGSEIMFGWQKNEIIFKHVSMLHSQEDSQAKLPLILQQVKELGQCELEIDLVKKDGQEFPVILTASQFRDADGNLTGYIFMAKDITERKKLEYQVFQSEKLAAIGQLATGIAHEINNPLFVISGRLEMLLEQKKMSQKTRESLEIINTQADRIRKLVDGMLKFSRRKPPKLETVNINEIIEGVLPLLAYHKLPQAKVEIGLELESGLGLVKGDLNQLQEVFINLFINAYQSMLEGGKLSIKTSNLQNQFAEIRISDTGCGIPEQNLKNIFMPFFSTKKEGTGLGLSICYNIIKNHNGAIDIESQVNKGTTFIIRLPFA